MVLVLNCLDSGLIVLFVSLIGYALYFDIDLFPLHFISGLIPMYFGLFDVAKGGEKWGVEKLLEKA